MNEEMIQKEIKKMRDRKAELDRRVGELVIVDPFSVVIERIDTKKISTFLALDPAADKNRLNESSVGRIISISDIISGDESVENKKAFLKKDCHVHFNHETAFHLALAGYYEIWVTHIFNIICVDKEYDPVSMYEKNLRKQLDR